MATGRTRGRRAFTLVELLVVIAIVAVLAGLAFPVLSTVRASSKNGQCVSNLRQIFAALSLYCQEHANQLPQRYYGYDQNGQKLGYPELILPYVDPGRTPDRSTLAKKLYVCPAQAKNDYPAEPGYGMNWFYDNANLAVVSPTTQTICLAETAGSGGTGARRADRDNYSGDIGKLDATRHRGRANYVFFDGHVEALAYDQTRQPLTGSTIDRWGTDGGDHSRPAPTPPY